MRRPRRGSWGPRRALDESTCQVMVGDRVPSAAVPAQPLHAPIPAPVPGVLSQLHGKESA
jgi:hypothetical protein